MCNLITLPVICTSLVGLFMHTAQCRVAYLKIYNTVIAYLWQCQYVGYLESQISQSITAVKSWGVHVAERWKV